MPMPYRDMAQIEAARMSLEKEVSDTKKENLLLQSQVEMEKMKTETEKKKLLLAQDTIKEKVLVHQ